MNTKINIIRSNSLDERKRENKVLEKYEGKLDKFCLKHGSSQEFKAHDLFLIEQQQQSSAHDSAILGKRKRNKKCERLRKKPEQMDILRRVFKENRGKMPARAQRVQLAEQLGLRQKQVYKWFWEIKKQRECESSEYGSSEQQVNDGMTVQQKFEAFLNMKPTTSNSKAKQYPKVEGFKTSGA